MKTEEIKQIPVMSVMDKLWVRYFKKWSWEFWIYDGWDKTNWWSFNINKNIIAEFSKDRASWDVFWFVKQHLNINDSETFKRFKENFDVWEDTKKPIRMVWNWLQELWQQQIDYLKTRGIKYDLVKENVKLYGGGVSCLIREWWVPKGINTRTMYSQKNKRFLAMKWYSTKWVYMWKLVDDKPIIVVEWLIDFLTLVQFYPNVVWLKSAESGIEEIQKLSKKYDIIFIPDQDAAGKITMDKFTFRHAVFDLSKYWDYKDINDMHMYLMNKDIIQAIIDDSKKKLPIDISFDKFNKMQATIIKNGKLWIDWPFEEIYKPTQWVVPWKVYTIWAFSNVGKSKFAYHHTQFFLSEWKSVLFVNLEVGEDMCLWNIICSREKCTYWDLIHWHKPKRDYYKNLIIRDDLYKLDDIEKAILDISPDIVIIDFVQNIQSKGSDYERHSNIARTIQRCAITTNATIFSLSQLSNSVGSAVQSWNTDFVSLKWSWEYFASSDVIFILRKWDGDNEIEVKIQKNKFWRNWQEFTLWVDYQRSNFSVKDASTGIAF